MDRIDEEITRLRRLIQLERDKEYNLYTGSILTATLEERRRLGVCWQPLKVIDSGYGMGDYPYLIVERTRGIGISHQFTAGSMASLYTVDREPGAEPVSGTIHWADEDKLKIILHSEDIPDWVDRCSLGINFMFDEKTYREMDRALEELMDTSHQRARSLFDKSRGHSPFLFREESWYEIPSLNESQNRALQKMMGARDIGVIHGPPGTGKTTTLVEIILQLVKREKQVLICAPSNTACDLLAEKLAGRGLTVLRLGNLSRIDPAILELTLEHKIGSHDQAKEIKKIRRRAGELRAKAGKYKRNFGAAEREERRFLY
ncbi:MAG: AAA domain-containing protein, partial [Candidatus Pacearchaeota archaeon]|nr:AAA domain-containing protein [Candidatus Pacearchaeota archaeon]